LGALSIGYALGSSAGPMLGSWLVMAQGFNAMFLHPSGIILTGLAIFFTVHLIWKVYQHTHT